MAHHPRVLVVDADSGSATALMQSLGPAGYETSHAATPGAGAALLQRAGADVVLLALHDEDLRGVTQLAGSAAEAQLIVLAPPALRAAGRQALRLGACDVLEQGDDVEGLLHAVERAARERQLRREVALLRARVDDESQQALVGRSAAITRVRELIGRAAASRLTVLISGEAGSGKDVVARLIHDLSHRAGRPYIVVRCEGTAPAALEEELFGAARGGLLETARGGTLVLDEIGAIPRALRARLAQMLVERVVERAGTHGGVPVDVRLVLTTRVLPDETTAGGRDELLGALTLLPVTLPPLRERRSDIPLLVHHFRRRLGREMGVELPALSTDAMAPLLGHQWPGNVRELEHWIDRMALSTHPVSGGADGAAPSPTGMAADFSQLDAARLSLEALERRYILHVLEQEQGHQSRAADRLGIDRRTLYRKLKEYRAEDDPVRKVS
jgi:DNA-binding NtrC family response regulator